MVNVIKKAVDECEGKGKRPDMSQKVVKCEKLLVHCFRRRSVKAKHIHVEWFLLKGLGLAGC